MLALSILVAFGSTEGTGTDAEKRRLATISPNFFQLHRPSTQGKRSCPVPPWKAHGFETQETCGACSHHIETMRSVGCASAVVTDKVEAHSYHIMYGIFLLPLRHSPRPVKLLEIGLGCDMHYEPGASASLWPKLLPDAEIWMAEHDAACVQESMRRGWLPGIRTLTGDQSDPAVTARWLRESGGAFDATSIVVLRVRFVVLLRARICIGSVPRALRVPCRPPYLPSISETGSSISETGPGRKYRHGSSGPFFPDQEQETVTTSGLFCSCSCCYDVLPIRYRSMKCSARGGLTPESAPAEGVQKCPHSHTMSAYMI